MGNGGIQIGHLDTDIFPIQTVTQGSYRTGASYEQVDREWRIHSGETWKEPGQEHTSTNCYQPQEEAMVQRRRGIVVSALTLTVDHVTECKRDGLGEQAFWQASRTRT
jgi:hypothetical protein